MNAQSHTFHSFISFQPLFVMYMWFWWWNGVHMQKIMEWSTQFSMLWLWLYQWASVLSFFPFFLPSSTQFTIRPELYGIILKRDIKETFFSSNFAKKIAVLHFILLYHLLHFVETIFFGLSQKKGTHIRKKMGKKCMHACTQVCIFV